ncbi:hypothetical protein [Pectobacterium wasabiae]|nr:hypothetical protein [Pectobacterium wasabiae]
MAKQTFEITRLTIDAQVGEAMVIVNAPNQKNTDHFNPMRVEKRGINI